MKIRNLQLANFRCFRELEMSFHGSLTVLVAPNGGGKSTVLDALAYVLSVFVGEFDKSQQRQPDLEDVRVIHEKGESRTRVHPSGIGLAFDAEGFNRTLLCRRVLAGAEPSDETHMIVHARSMLDGLHSEKPRADVTLPIVAYYGSRRTAAAGKYKVGWDLGSAALMRDEGYAGCLTANANASLFRTWYGKAAIAELGVQIKLSKGEPVAPSERKLAERARAVKDTVNLILSGASDRQRFWLDLFLSMNQVGVLDSEQDVELGLDQLSDGVQCMLSLAGDLAARCAVLNPQFGAHAPSETPGVVLIDEVDLHLHPAWQQRVLADLQGAFPRVQFIVTTHSPQVLTTVRKENIRLLAADGTVRMPDDGTYGAESSRVLAELFGVHPRPPTAKSVGMLSHYLALVEKGEGKSPKATQLRAELEDAFGSHDPDLLTSDIRASQLEFLGRR